MVQKKKCCKSKCSCKGKPSKKQMQQAGEGLFSSIAKLAGPLVKQFAPSIIDAGCAHVKRKVAGNGKKKPAAKRKPKRK